MATSPALKQPTLFADHFSNISQLESSLWEAADQLRANSKLTSSEYCMPVLGVIFLRHATNRFEAAKAQIASDQAKGKMPKRKPVKADFVRRRALFLPDVAHYDFIANFPKSANLGGALVSAMTAIEDDFEPLKGQGIAFTDGVSSSDAIVIRAMPEELRSFVLMTVSSDPFVAETSQSMREGSKMPRTDWKPMTRYPIALPPEGLLKTFNETITSITDQLRNLCFQNRKLQEARDLLLPRLMNGEIAV